jgi:Mrp family chromosome partitioning ATPase
VNATPPRAEAIPNLAMLPSGAPPAYSAEMLASPKMMKLIEGWRSAYDHVVIDTPPVSMFTDAVVLGARSDATLLVARASLTTKQALRQARDVLRRANINVAGMVLKWCRSAAAKQLLPLIPICRMCSASIITSVV